MTTIVIGNGPAGVRFAQELLKRKPDASVTLFGNEPCRPYNRVQLSALLSGQIEYENIFTLLPNQNHHPGFSHEICAIKDINVENHTVTDAKSRIHRYQHLVIATGSRAHVPHIPGVDQTGVYTFRNLRDTEFLSARTSRARHIVVVGGGLLGLEAARALLRANTQVTLVQQGPRLMNRQLDFEAAALLQNRIEKLGIRVITDSGVRKIHGQGRVTAVTTRSKETIECDTVLLCTGITPNIEIARNAKITVARGIVVNDQLKTSAPDIFAIGECCEHRGLTYGLVNPGFEQAAVVADIICGGASQYIGSLEVSRLKVVGETVCSMGQVADLEKRPRQSTIKYKNRNQGIYRKLVLHKNRLIGAISYGEWPETRRVQETYQQQRKIQPWQQLMFMLTGNIWTRNTGQNIRQWPGTTVVCQCNNISQSELVTAVAEGCKNVASLSHKTQAGTVCGSCKPLLAQLVGNSAPAEKEKASLPVLLGSISAIILAACIFLMPELTASHSVQTPGTIEFIWNDKFWKQVTGFSLLGMSVLGLLMSLRKRIKNRKLTRKMGEFAYWRLLHVMLGVFCATTLILHTGLHLGENLNQMLMINFLLVLLLGSMAGAVISLSHKLDASASQKLRKFWTWTHIFVTWPLPILIGTHILTVYYF